MRYRQTDKFMPSSLTSSSFSQLDSGVLPVLTGHQPSSPAQIGQYPLHKHASVIHAQSGVPTCDSQAKVIRRPACFNLRSKHACTCPPAAAVLVAGLVQALHCRVHLVDVHAHADLLSLLCCSRMSTTEIIRWMICSKPAPDAMVNSMPAARCLRAVALSQPREHSCKLVVNCSAADYQNCIVRCVQARFWPWVEGDSLSCHTSKPPLGANLRQGPRQQQSSHRRRVDVHPQVCNRASHPEQLAGVAANLTSWVLGCMCRRSSGVAYHCTRSFPRVGSSFESCRSRATLRVPTSLPGLREKRT